ncbi:hypothetical protein Lesp02_11410 [Lentzea sp. NBRC 105346]|uniref:DUF58 domain-containing protein n=1 Tax=Lentzea sp. NBRC 105346 TaxID=3032205 RepID=UPI0024A3B5E1|nr:DUF58 domain-containing protein [Lentzea sp. NBRC 105346]GLZ28951.1 hypothetical protein Lesp02_11410 [Lentzea sp. NBRC 105346]
MRLTLRGTGVLVLGLVLVGLGLWWRYPGVAGLGLAFAGLVVAAVVSVLRSPPIVPSRVVRPRTVHRLGRCSGRLSLESSGTRWPVAVDASDMVAGSPVVVDVPVLAPGSPVAVEYPIPTAVRGVFDVGPLTLHRKGLAGLAFARVVLGEVVQVRVVPRVLPVRGLPSGVRRGQVGADERVERGGTDLVGLREYVPGDDLRRLHWATSARTGTLMVREDADPARPHLAVLLDDGAYPSADAFEHAVEVAASLVSSALEDGHPVHLLTTSGSLDLPGTDSDAALAALADLRPASGGGAVVPVRDLDVVAVICGSSSSSLLLEAGRAAVGVLLEVSPVSEVSASGSVLMLRGPRAEDLLDAWNAVVAR